jgi:nucleoside-diphosphate-sugar epimerase
MTGGGDRPLVLITGAAGLIGSKIIRELAEDHVIVGFDIAAPKERLPVADWIECDLTDDRSTRDSLERVRQKQGERLASVIHLAAYYDFSGEPSPLYERLTVEGTRRLLDELKRFDVEQFVFSSSLLVMKPTGQGETITEASPTQAEWAYPESKLRAEQVISEKQGKIPAVVLRVAGVYDEDCHSIPIAQQIRRIDAKDLESYFFPGNPEHGQSFVHLDDLAGCFRRVVDRRRALDPHEVFLIGEPDVVSYGELQDIIGERLHGKEWPTIRVPKTVAKAGAWAQQHLPGETFIKPWMVDLADAHYPVDIAKARRKLAWQPRHSLRDTLPKMLDRLKTDRRRWYKTNKLEPPGDA